MANGYEEIEKGVMYIVSYALGIFAIGYFLYQFTVNVLPWLLLSGAILGGIIFFFWYRSQQRSQHPWE